MVVCKCSFKGSCPKLKDLRRICQWGFVYDKSVGSALFMSKIKSLWTNTNHGNIIILTSHTLLGAAAANRRKLDFYIYTITAKTANHT